MLERGGRHLFTIKGVPVSVSPIFFLIQLYLVVRFGVADGLGLGLAYFLSVLIHEFGHALPCLRYRLSPEILIHALGGLCFHQRASTDGRDALIVVLGPLLQIGVGLLVFGVMVFITPVQVLGATPAALWLEGFLLYFCWFSVIWGGLNLLAPIFPLDGGRLFHLILRRFISPDRAQYWALKISLGFLIPAALYVAWSALGEGGSLFLLFIMGTLVLDNVRAMQSSAPLIQRGAGPMGAHVPAKKLGDFGQELFERAESAFDEQDWREAARLCHQLRASTGAIPNQTLLRVWAILGLAHTEMGDHRAALAFLKRAGESSEVEAARQRCEAALASNSSG